MWAATVVAQSAGAPLVLEAKIPLGQVSGRIDHLGIDVKRQRLFVAELGNNSLGVVDLAAGKVLRTVTGLSEPQGVAYVPSADSVFVANAGDGSVHVLRGDDLAPIGRIELGEDADNVRVDTQRNRVLVGYGKGALAVIDPATRTKAADIRLKGHPVAIVDISGTNEIWYLRKTDSSPPAIERMIRTAGGPERNYALPLGSDCVRFDVWITTAPPLRHLAPEQAHQTDQRPAGAKAHDT